MSKSRLRQAFQRRFPAATPLYFTSFLILHEVTAVVPIPLCYYAIHQWQLAPTLLDQPWIKETSIRIKERFASKGHIYWEKWFPASTDWPVTLMEWTAAYAVVKALMPARIALSLALTPWLTRRAIEPLWKRWSR